MDFYNYLPNFSTNIQALADFLKHELNFNSLFAFEVFYALSTFPEPAMLLSTLEGFPLYSMFPLPL
ncbi:MAG: hypothetical protein ACPG49_13430, partial [Chitinophagales bacterium]